jgi:hypothetical protein
MAPEEFAALPYDYGTARAPEAGMMPVCKEIFH